MLTLFHFTIVTSKTPQKLHASLLFTTVFQEVLYMQLACKIIQHHLKK